MEYQKMINLLDKTPNQLSSSENCVICSTIRKTKFAIADTKLYVTIYVTNCTQNIIFQK